MRTLFILFFSFLGIYSHSQNKITFKDGKSIVVSGEKIGEKFDYSLDNPNEKRKVSTYYLSQKDSVFTLFVLTTWLTEGAVGKLDDLRIYKFTISQQEYNPSLSEETDDNENVIGYSLGLSAKEDRPFKYDVYTIYSSSPSETRTWSTLRIYSENKEKLEGLELKLKLPESEE
ncbi:MAG: hypothetical protein RL264_789 [Bacteroidota bacterium]